MINSIRDNPHDVCVLLKTQKTSNVLMWLKEHESSGTYHYYRDWESGNNTDTIMALKCFFSNQEDAVLFALKFK